MFSIIVAVAALMLSRPNDTLVPVLEGSAQFAGVLGISYAMAYALLEIAAAR